VGSYRTEKLLLQLIGYNYPMKCHRLYLIADSENFILNTLKMGDILQYGLRKACVNEGKD